MGSAGEDLAPSLPSKSSASIPPRRAKFAGVRAASSETSQRGQQLTTVNTCNIFITSARFYLLALGK